MEPHRRLHTARLAAIIVAGGLTVVAAGCSDDEPVDTAGTTTSPVTTDPTTSAAPTTTAPAPATPLSRDEAAFALWPDPAGEARFDDPVEAARSFAVDLVGFDDPVLGELREGDARSGEIELQPSDDGPVSTVLVRQLGEDDSWWVIGMLNDDIVVDDPVGQQAVDHPLLLAGEARAFEGTVEVAVFADGSTEPLGEGFVTGSGGEDLGPFEGEVAFDVPQGGWGTVLFFTTSAEDGSVLVATAVRVGFIGGD